MKLKRTIIISLLSLTLIVPFSACKSDRVTTNTPTEKVASTPTATPMRTIETTGKPTPTAEPLPLVTIEPGTGKYSEGIKDENTRLIAYLDKENPDLLEGLHIEASTSVSIQFFPTTTFDRIYVRLCTWDQKSGHSIEISLYNWQGSYDTTLASTAIFTNVYKDYSDNIWLEVVLEKEYVDGEYLIDVTNISSAEHVGVWVSSEEQIMQRFYKDGDVYEDGIAQFAIGYTKTPNKIYGPLSETGF